MKRKSFTVGFKSKVSIAALKGHQTINEIASEFEVHPSQVNSWKKQLLEGAADIFGCKKQQQAEDFNSEREKLFCQIGRLNVELDWLKKKTGHLG